MLTPQQKVPVNETNKILVSPIHPNNPQGELIRTAALILCDKAPMGNRSVIKCVEETCHCVMCNNLLFGGKVMILGGDFCQTCPVIHKGSRIQIIETSIKSCPFWNQIWIFQLTQPVQNAEDLPFTNFVNAIRDGAGPNVSLAPLQIINDTESILQFVFPSHILQQLISCLRRSILTPTNEQIDSYNHILIDHIDGTQRTYRTADSLKEINTASLILPDSALDYTAKQTPPGLPPHSLTIKVNGIYCLLQNFSLDHKLIKNIWVIVSTRLVTVHLIWEQHGILHSDNKDILIP